MILDVAMLTASVLLSLAAMFTVYRLARGPSLLDRVIAADVLLAVVGAAVGLEMIYHHHLNNLVLLVILSLVGFLGSVTMARHATERKND